MKKSTFPDHLCSKHQSLFAVSWSQVQILACHLLDECPWTSQFIVPKAQFPHLRNGNGHNRSESLWELHDVTGKIPLNLTFSMCTMEIISSTQDFCEMVYIWKFLAQNCSSTKVHVFDSLGPTHSLPTHHPTKLASFALSPNKMNDYFQMQESNYTCAL